MPCASGIFRKPGRFGSVDGPPLGKTPLSQGLASRHHPTSAVVDRGLRLRCLRVVRGMLVDLELETVRVGYEWVPKGLLLVVDTAAVGGKYM